MMDTSESERPKEEAEKRRTGAIGSRKRRQQGKKSKYRRGRATETKTEMKEDGEIEHPRGSDNQLKMEKVGDRGDGEGGPTAMAIEK